MKTFGELTPQEQRDAWLVAQSWVTSAIILGSVRFDEPELNEMALGMRTAWRYSQYIARRPQLGAAIKRLALARAAECMYAELTDPDVIWGVIE